MANFGRVPYGYKLRGQVFYDFDNTDQDYACSQLSDYHFSEKELHYKIVPTIMIDRGSCHFTKKVKNVEAAGGAIAVIINNEQYNDVEQIIMADDGSGRDITIPAVLISKADGEKIKQFIKENPKEKVIIEFDFELVDV